MPDGSPSTALPLCFAHANGFPSAAYARLLDVLGGRFAVRAVSTLGTDPRYPVDDNWRSLTDQVIALARAESPNPVIGVGHSLGGLLTFMAAHRHPELYRAIVILDPPVMNGPDAPLIWAMKRLGRADQAPIARASAKRQELFASRDEARKSLGSKRLFREFDRDCFEDYLNAGLTESPDGFRLTIPSATEVAIFATPPTDSWRYATRLRVPATLITAKNSNLAGPRFDRLARRHRMRRIELEGSHMFPLEQPRVTADAILEAIDAMGVR